MAFFRCTAATCPKFRPTVWTFRGLTAAAHCQLTPTKRLPQAQFRANHSCFLLSDEKLLGRLWVLIRIATALCRLVAATL
jgi:hypothetical protein